MNKSIAEMITEMIKEFNLTKEFLADKFGVTVTTIDRWGNNGNEPKKITRRYIRQVYNGYNRGAK